MSVRRLLAGVADRVALVGRALALAAPAHADPTFVPVAADIVGVGSDTTQFALTYLADGNAGIAGYNAGRPPRRLVSFDATGGGDDRPSSERRGRHHPPQRLGCRQGPALRRRQQPRRRLRPLLLGHQRRRERRRPAGVPVRHGHPGAGHGASRLATLRPTLTAGRRSSRSTRAPSPTGASSAAPPASSSRRSRRPARAPARFFTASSRPPTAASPSPSAAASSRSRSTTPRRSRTTPTPSRRSRSAAPACSAHAAHRGRLQRRLARSTTWCVGPTSATPDGPRHLRRRRLRLLRRGQAADRGRRLQAARPPGQGRRLRPAHPGPRPPTSHHRRGRHHHHLAGTSTAGRCRHPHRHGRRRRPLPSGSVASIEGAHPGRPPVAADRGQGDRRR